MTQSMTTPAAPFTASKNVTSGVASTAPSTDAAAPKTSVAKMSGRRSMSAAARTGFRGMISRSRSSQRDVLGTLH